MKMMSFRSTMALLFVALAMRATPLYANDLPQSNSNDAIIQKSESSIGSLRGSSDRSRVLQIDLASGYEEAKEDRKKVMGECQCKYHNPHSNPFWGGGCYISQAPTIAGTVCKCYMKFAYTCGGETENCTHDQLIKNTNMCLYPGTSKAFCELGGGNCNGY